MTYHSMFNKSNTTAATNGTGTAYPSGAHVFILVLLCGIRVAQSLVCLYCLSFDLLLLVTWMMSHGSIETFCMFSNNVVSCSLLCLSPLIDREPGPGWLNEFGSWIT